MTLRAFEEKDDDLLIGWIDSEQLNYLWGGPKFDFPLDTNQIRQHCSQPQVHPFVFDVEGKAAGYVELYKESDTHFRICRVFVSNVFRGQGIAKTMLSQLIKLAKAEFKVRLLSLAVFEHNQVAKHCYESLGFVQTSREMGTRSFEGEIWALLLMEKQL
ncbi:GNAT family N-acetyltransferase [Vibrio aquaticus]|uniref:GNAT family N-acetyltransferase n=2 Tax=Pseudomonadati TaxID=3379134 RepID=A0A3S0MLI5_9VIBR|nr:GNAT family N-acetyltransferase [Vibrio aquaticus]RTZ17268.1 GNAT family N-acetyltransferase [Vibrio aquaticus]